MSHWHIRTGIWTTIDYPCTGPGNLEPLVVAFGSRSEYSANDEGTEVYIKHPLNPDFPIIAKLIQ
jgi:hypothetical protein